jgi:hypothetical protein
MGMGAIPPCSRSAHAQKVPGYPLLFRLRLVDDGRSGAIPPIP